MLGNNQAWFRVYFLFGEIIPCWWNKDNYRYSFVTLREMYNHKLLPLARLTSEIARVTSMEFFSTEIAVTKKDQDKKFVVIDYVNDQPELCVRTAEQGGGPVPEVVQHVAERMVEIAWRVREGMPIGVYRSIWMSRAKTEDETI